jgi:tellurite resistance protein TehA-like permease
MEHIKNFKTSAMQHYLTNWRWYEDVATIAFFGSSVLTGAYGTFQWIRHRKIRTTYTQTQYHRMVKNSSRLGLLITTSLLTAANMDKLVPYCERKLAEATQSKN